jgi:Zn-dependent protease with chaperone function
MIGLRSIRLGLELMRLGFTLLGQAFEFLFDVLRLLFYPPQPEPELDDSPFPPMVARLSSPQFPEFHVLQQSVAAELGLKAADELWVSPDAVLGITTARREGRRVRCLVVGLELVRTLTPEQLRAALLHEFGHERGGDLWLGHWARQLIHRLLFAAHRFSLLNPARWSAELSLLLVKLGYLPWSRAKEYAADGYAARHAGPVVFAETLRTLRREAPVVELALHVVLQRAEARRRSPVRLGEAVRRIVAQIPPSERHRLGQRAEGDPLDLGGRTHPPIALRIAAMAHLPKLPATRVPAFDPERLAQLDERLTRQWLEGRGKVVSVDEFFAADEPVRRVAPEELHDFAPEQVVSGSEISGFDSSADEAPLELDTERDWLKRR